MPFITPETLFFGFLYCYVLKYFHTVLVSVNFSYFFCSVYLAAMSFNTQRLYLHCKFAIFQNKMTFPSV